MWNAEPAIFRVIAALVGLAVMASISTVGAGEANSRRTPNSTGLWPEAEFEINGRVRRIRPPAAEIEPRAEIVSGYRVRNYAVPMYNEPPRRAPVW